MKRFIALLGLSAFLIAALLFANQQRQQTPAYILAQYPQTPTIKILTRLGFSPPQAPLF